MNSSQKRDAAKDIEQDATPHVMQQRVEGSLPNYTLSTICPACGAETYRLACKVRCDRCGFMWDCSEV